MLVHLRLEEQMDGAIEATVREELFKTKSEFIRDAIRKNLEEYALRRSLSRMKDLQGSASPRPGLSRRENFLAFEKAINSRDRQD